MATTAHTSNRLLTVSNPPRQFGHDNAGNTVWDQQASAAWTAGYDLSNRLATLTRSWAAPGRPAQTVSLGYLYNTDGQRVAKLRSLTLQCQDTPPVCSNTSTPEQALVYVYDQQGQLLGEYRAADGATVREYFWLGNQPVAVLAPEAASAADPSGLFYLHTDHLNTPRMVLDRFGRPRWWWMGEPFGASEPNTNPQGLGPFIFNLRFPGQIHDDDAGLTYNHHRDYDAGVGRYVQSDPIGLAGGGNTYAYVENQPTMMVDPLGLATCIYSVRTGRMDCMRNGNDRVTWTGTFASGNNKEVGCKNNPDCEKKQGIGPIPRGCWSWSGPGSSGKPGGRALTPLHPFQSRPFGRDLFRTHSCDNPFGPSLGPTKVCSEGCVTSTRGTVAELNTLIDAEPSVLCVFD